MAGRRNCQFAAPADGVDMRVQLGNGQGIAPFGLNIVFGRGCDRSPRPVGSCKEVRVEALESRARHWNLRLVRQRRALSVVDLRSSKLSGKAVDRLYWMMGNSVVVSFQSKDQIRIGARR